MHKKVILSCMAVVAFAAIVVLPAVASAAPRLTLPTGTTAAVGTKIHRSEEHNSELQSRP